MTSEEVLNQWNMIAGEYSKNQRNAQTNFINWQMLKDLLGNIEDKNLLDAGCGDGFFSNQLLSLGAKVFAFDGSKELIKIAKNEFENIDFCVADLTKKLPYNDNQFDIVVSSLTLMAIENIDLFLSECKRVLKQNGKLIFSFVHPCFFHLGTEEDKNTNKKLNNYYAQSNKIIHFWGETVHYHRPISWYAQKLFEQDFLIEQISENPKDMQNLDYMNSGQKRIPMFIAFCCVVKK